MNRARALLIALGVLLVGGGVAWFAVIDADARSTGLLGLSSDYKDVVLAELGRPESFAHPLPPCATGSLASFETTAAGNPICSSALIAQTDTDACDPVTTTQKIPRYVWWGGDLLEVKIGVVGGDAAQLAQKLDAFDQAALQKTGLGAGRGDLTTRSKSVAAMQCDGYALIDVRQHYFFFNR